MIFGGTCTECLMVCYFGITANDFVCFSLPRKYDKNSLPSQFHDFEKSEITFFLQLICNRLHFSTSSKSTSLLQCQLHEDGSHGNLALGIKYISAYNYLPFTELHILLFFCVYVCAYSRRRSE